jgi:hypothetical protein
VLHALATVVRGGRRTRLPPCLSKHVREDIQTVPRAMVSGHRREARRFTSPSPGATGRGGDVTATRCRRVSGAVACFEFGSLARHRWPSRSSLS